MLKRLKNIAKELIKSVPEASKVIDCQISNTINFASNLAFQILTARAWGIIK